MKVFFITMQFPAPREIFANNDAITLCKLGVDISVHSLRLPHKEKARFEIERGITHINHTHNSVKKTFDGILYGLVNLKVTFTLLNFIFKHNYRSLNQLFKSCVLAPRIIDIFKEFRKEKPDVVHLYWAHYPSMLGYLVKKFYPNTILSMSFVAYDLHMRYKGSFVVANLADAVFTIAKMEVNTLVNLGIDPKKIQTVYHGLLPNYFIDESPKKIKGKVVSVGAFVPGKNMDLIVDVFAKVQKKLPDISLVLIGDGPLRKKSEKLVKDDNVNNVVFLGHSSHQTVISEMREAEIFLFMSEDERLPNVVKEAMVSKCFIITTETPGINELIINEEYGSIIAVGNLIAAENSLEKAFSDVKNRKKAVEKSYQYIKANFNVRDCMKKYISTWNNLFERSTN